MPYFRITLKFNQQSLGSAFNVFYFRNSVGSPTDTQIRTVATDYINDIFDTLRNSMDAGCTFSSCQIDEVNLANETIRSLGSITPTVSGTASGDQLSLFTAGSMFARTDRAKTRGSKRLPGISEGRHVDGLFDNTLITALVNAALAYFSERGSVLTWIFQPGVISLIDNTWHALSGSAVVTNVPGSQVTRKVGRGV